MRYAGQAMDFFPENRKTREALIKSAEKKGVSVFVESLFDRGVKYDRIWYGECAERRKREVGK